MVIHNDALRAPAAADSAGRLSTLRDFTNRAFEARTLAIADPSDARVSHFLLTTRMDHVVLGYMDDMTDATSMIARAALEDFLECAVTNKLLDGAMTASQRVDHMIASVHAFKLVR